MPPSSTPVSTPSTVSIIHPRDHLWFSPQHLARLARHPPIFIIDATYRVYNLPQVQLPYLLILPSFLFSPESNGEGCRLAAG